MQHGMWSVNCSQRHPLATEGGVSSRLLQPVCWLVTVRSLSMWGLNLVGISSEDILEAALIVASSMLSLPQEDHVPKSISPLGSCHWICSGSSNSAAVDVPYRAMVSWFMASGTSQFTAELKLWSQH